MATVIPPTQADLLAAELAKMRLCPGNEAHSFAERILKIVHDTGKKELEMQLDKDDVDLDELVKNDKAIMEAIVSMSKLVTATYDLVNRQQEGKEHVGGPSIGA